MKFSQDDQALENLKELLRSYQNRMLTKKEVAAYVGMTVSWLDNSQSPKAQKLRQAGIRYGISRTSPIRFPLQEVLKICLQDEGGKHS